MSRNPYRELRRYAIAGKLHLAERLLHELLEQDPEDTFASGELQRLEKGIPLLSALPNATFRPILQDSITARLTAITTRTPEAALRRLSTEQLREVGGRFRSLGELLALCGGSMPREQRRYARTLRQNLRKRWVHAHRPLMFGLSACALLLPIAGISTVYLKQRAESAAQMLDQAVLNGRWQEINDLRHAADTGVYHLLHPAISSSIYKADTWLIQKQQCYNLASRRLAPIRKGERTVESLSLSERAAMERELRDIPPGLDDLSPIWRKLCQKEQDALALAQSREMARLHEPLPEWPDWTGDPAKDAEALRPVLEGTQQRLQEYQDAILAYHLPEDETTPLHERIAEIRARLEALESMDAMLQDLDKAEDYGGYTSAISRETQAPWYATASALGKAREHLPQADAVRLLMANREGLLPQDFVEEAMQTFLEAGPTFTASNPANTQQVELMEDLFTAQVLRTRLLELRDEHGRYAYTADKIDFTGKDYITFSRHVLDPAYALKKRETLAWRTKGLRYRDIDVSPLVQAAGLDRRTFYVKANLPQALSAVLSTEAKDCPALARAYIYDRLLQVLMAHPDRPRIGMGFSPSLQEDSRSFITLRDASGIELSPGCWLAPSESKKEADGQFRIWFQKHRSHDYAREISRNFAASACVHPRYAGYIDRQGRIKPCLRLQQDTELWYTDKDGATRHAASPEDGMVWPDALPFSPLFIVEKDTP